MNVQSFLRLLKRHRPAGWIIAGAVLLGLGETALSLLIPLMTKNLVEQVSASALQTATIIGLAAVFIVQTGMSAFSVYAMSYVGQFMVGGIRRELWERVLKLPVSFFDRNSSGETMSRVTNDTNVIKEFIVGHVISFLSGIVAIVGGVSILFYIDWRMTLLMLLAVPAALLVLWPLGSRMFKVSKAMQDETAMFQGDLGRVLSEIRLVKASLAEDVEERQGKLRINSLFRYGLKEARILSVVTPMMTTVMLLILVLLIGYGGVRVAQNELSTGELVAIILYMFQIVMPFTQMASFFTQFQKALGASDRVIELLEEKREPSQQGQEAAARAIAASGLAAIGTDEGDKGAEAREGEVSFEDIGFSYSEDRPILSGVTFRSVAGGMTAIVGPSGGGKTTLFSLLERFYEAGSGVIKYGDKDIRDLPVQEWRRKLAYVSQESPMMAGSIRYNLTYGLDGAVEADIAAAIAGANLESFISSLPEGLETEVGERGVKLSGGQRQRLAIARAFLRDPEILLLDEATAHLDSESEQLVQEALQSLMASRTTLVIAHRLSTIAGADRIIVMEQGKVSGQGKHGELLQSNELYARLVNGQLMDGGSL